MTASLASISKDRLTALVERERSAYRAGFPASREAFASAGDHLLGGVPMTLMRMWPGGFPLYQAAASGASMALMCPATTQGDADAHTALFAAAADELLS